MAGEWQDGTLGDFLTLQRGFDLPQDNRVDGPYSVIASTGPVGTHREAMVKGPGVVIGRSGSLGGGQYIRADFWPLNTTLWVKDFKGNNPRFCYYFLKSMDFGRYNAGSGVPTLNRNHIHPLPVRFPPLKEQQAIACILGALDDKIELNRQMNKTLEEMARAIFKSWFVDFLPVRAKMAARTQAGGLKPEIAALFPDRLVDSELGEIPKGWRAGTLGEVADNPRRGIATDAIAAGTPYIALEHMPRRSIALADWATANEIESNKFEFHQGEILFGKLRPYFHKVGVAPVTGVCSTDILVIVPRHPNWFGFAACHLSSDEIIQHSDRASTGTKMPRTNWSDLSRFQIVIPKVDVAEAFNKQFKPMIDRIQEAIMESRTLSALRDTLLPKLISGELRIKDTERFLKERGL